LIELGVFMFLVACGFIIAHNFTAAFMEGVVYKKLLNHLFLLTIFTSFYILGRLN